MRDMMQKKTMERQDARQKKNGETRRKTKKMGRQDTRKKNRETRHKIKKYGEMRHKPKKNRET